MLLLLPLLSSPAFASSNHMGESSEHRYPSAKQSKKHGEDYEEERCPCFTERDLLTWFDSSDACYDYSVGTPSAPKDGTYLAYYDGQGMEAGVADYYYFNVPFCAAINLTTFAGTIVTNISPAQYNACAEIVLDAAEDLNLQCLSAP
jgi:hypothetical protein